MRKPVRGDHPLLFVQDAQVVLVEDAIVAIVIYTVPPEGLVLALRPALRPRPLTASASSDRAGFAAPGSRLAKVGQY